MVYVEVETKIFNKSKMISNLSSKQLDRSLFDLEVNSARKDLLNMESKGSFSFAPSINSSAIFICYFYLQT